MTIHIFKEENVVPATFSVNIRNVLDDGSPHLVTFGARTSVANPVTSSFVAMKVRYENPSGQIQFLYLDSSIDLKTLTEGGGGIWYRNSILVNDQYWPNSDGPNAEEPRGIFAIDFTLGGTNLLDTRFSYECLVEQFNGSPAVVYHP